MKILVTAATEGEIEHFTLQNETTDVLVTGVGAPACIYALTKQLQQKKYDIILQAGIAGMFKNSFELAQTVVVKQDVFADLGIYENNQFFTLFEKGFTNENKLPYSNGYLINFLAEHFSLAAANAITVNTVTDNKEQINVLIKKYDPEIESMEGAAFHYVCISEEVSFLQLRSISNVVGERDKANWKIKESIKNLNENLIRIVQQLQNKKL